MCNFTLGIRNFFLLNWQIHRIKKNRWLHKTSSTANNNLSFLFRIVWPIFRTYCSLMFQLWIAQFSGIVYMHAIATILTLQRT